MSLAVATPTRLQTWTLQEAEEALKLPHNYLFAWLRDVDMLDADNRPTVKNRLAKWLVLGEATIIKAGRRKGETYQKPLLTELGFAEIKRRITYRDRLEPLAAELNRLGQNLAGRAEQPTAPDLARKLLGDAHQALLSQEQGRPDQAASTLADCLITLLMIAAWRELDLTTPLLRKAERINGRSLR